MQQSIYPGLGQIPTFGGSYMRSKGRNRKGEPVVFKKVKMTTLYMFCWRKLSRPPVSLSSTLPSVASIAHAIARVLDNRSLCLDLPHTTISWHSTMLSAIRCLRIPCCSLDKPPSASVGTVGSASIVVVLPSEFGAGCSDGREVSTFISSSIAILKRDLVHHFLAPSCDSVELC